MTGRVARNKMYKRKIPKQQTAAAQVWAVGSSSCKAGSRSGGLVTLASRLV